MLLSHIKVVSSTATASSPVWIFKTGKANVLQQFAWYQMQYFLEYTDTAYKIVSYYTRSDPLQIK